LFIQQSATGLARVICFAPDHNKSLPQLSDQQIRAVVDTWKSQYEELSQSFECVHIFENKGEIMGCSQPHPHGQIWAHNHWSTEIQKKETNQKSYLDKHGKPLLVDYVDAELQRKDRIVLENDYWLVVVPYWAKWPFETMLVCKEQVPSFNQIKEEHAQALATILRLLTIKYDNVFNCSFPYSMGWHNAPSNLEDNSHWVLHAHFYPPLLRSATVKKHMVGYEMLAESQRDLTPEQAASILRDCPEVHYMENKNA
jgi:UDPglucose--hexose-1-phosphate uridylyltransferase